MRLFVFFAVMFAILLPNIAQAQYASQQTAAYLATLKAVMDYKIDDEENVDDINKLRQDQRFYEKLTKMLNKLQNTQNKDAKNKRVQKILEKAGEDIYKILN